MRGEPLARQRGDDETGNLFLGRFGPGTPLIRNFSLEVFGRFVGTTAPDRHRLLTTTIRAAHLGIQAPAVMPATRKVLVRLFGKIRNRESNGSRAETQQRQSPDQPPT
jgi:hypothetical protein